MSVMRDRINTFLKYKDLLRELVVRDIKLNIVFTAEKSGQT